MTYVDLQQNLKNNIEIEFSNKFEIIKKLNQGSNT